MKTLTQLLLSSEVLASLAAVKITAKQISFGERMELPGGLYLIAESEHDGDCEAPWEACEGHGEVSEWTSRGKLPGERILCSDRSSHRFYDYAAAIKTAIADGWDAAPYKTGTKGETAARAVEADFAFLKAWCDDRWSYQFVSVKLFDEDENELSSDGCGGVESFKDYNAEHAAIEAAELIRAFVKEQSEAAQWAARDSITV